MPPVARAKRSELAQKMIRRPRRGVPHLGGERRGRRLHARRMSERVGRQRPDTMEGGVQRVAGDNVRLCCHTRKRMCLEAFAHIYREQHLVEPLSGEEDRLAPITTHFFLNSISNGEICLFLFGLRTRCRNVSAVTQMSLLNWRSSDNIYFFALAN